MVDEIISNGVRLGYQGDQLIQYTEKHSAAAEKLLLAQQERDERAKQRDKHAKDREAQEREAARLHDEKEREAARQHEEKEREAARRHELELARIAASGKPSATSAPSASINLPRRPKLKCENFSGSESDKISFRDFKIQFENSISGHSLAKAIKFQHLIGHLNGYALSIVKQLAITDDNYDLAL